ncbi:hypothetical protein PCK2_000577 [Pneumocystis canis]|nr:hypothetical protein PCK2_000577 [Pneumocystis canis]
MTFNIKDRELLGLFLERPFVNVHKYCDIIIIEEVNKDVIRPKDTYQKEFNYEINYDASPSILEIRKRQSKKDEAIRRKLENELSKKKPTAARMHPSRKMGSKTVLSLSPSPPLTVQSGITVSEASQLMAAKREDCVLVVDDDQHLMGIFTSKDLAFRVVGMDMDPRNLLIEDIMTKNPLCARNDTSAIDALDLMVHKGFRHLPVCDEDGNVSGILDITKCFHEAMKKVWIFPVSIKNINLSSESILSDNQLSTSQNYQPLLYTSLPNNQQDIQVLSPDMSATKIPQKNEWTSPSDRSAFQSKNSPLLSQIPFVFKFKSMYGKTHRIQLIPQAGYASLRLAIIERLRSELEKLGRSDDLAISFIDDDGDAVSMTTDDDMFHAVELAYKNAEDKVNLIVHHPNSSIIHQNSDHLSSTLEDHHEKAPPYQSHRLTGYCWNHYSLEISQKQKDYLDVQHFYYYFHHHQKKTLHTRFQRYDSIKDENSLGIDAFLTLVVCTYEGSVALF